MIVEPLQQQQQLPMMTIQVTPGGILLTIIRSAFDKQDIMIPSSNADAMAAEWLASRPPEVKSAAVKQLTKLELARVNHALKVAVD